MKTALVLGGGEFIGGHLANRLKRDGFYVRIADIEKRHRYWNTSEICNEFMSGDLREPEFVKEVMSPVVTTGINSDGFDEVYQLAADMGGAGYIFTGENDAMLIRYYSNLIHQYSNRCMILNHMTDFYCNSPTLLPLHQLEIHFSVAFWCLSCAILDIYVCIKILMR